MAKERLDILLVERGLATTRQRARAAIMEGRGIVDCKKVEKAGTPVKPEAVIRITGHDLPYVSRGGLKLEKAIKVFGVSVTGKTVADIGASTGGFTDCMLQNGAERVYAVDVGTDQLDKKLKNDGRVISLEKLDIRSADSSHIPEKIGFITVDVSFISLKAILPEIKRFSAPGAVCCALIKPQFELGKAKLGKSGVVRDSKLREKAVKDITGFAAALGFTDIRTVPSKITGGDGNLEYLMCSVIP